MGQAGFEGEARFAAVVRELSGQPGVTYTSARGTQAGQSVIRVHDQIFAMLSSEGQLVVKLPKSRVDALVDGVVHQRFDTEPGWPANDWLELHSESSSAWLALAREALKFVQS